MLENPRVATRFTVNALWNGPLCAMADGMEDAKTTSMMPPQRVLAAIDFSEASRTALSCAARLARHCNSELHVVHVPPFAWHARTSPPGGALAAEISEELRAFVDATPNTAAAHPRCHIVAGETARVIRDIAKRERCDVIVVGAHGLSVEDVYPLGPTTEQLLHEADIPVLVVPREWTPPDPATTDMTGVGPVIAGLDFTCPSIDAASAAAHVAARLHTRLLLVHAVPRVPVSAGSPGDARLRAAQSIADQELADARAQLEPLLAALRAIAPVDVHVEIGGVVPTLLHAAENLPGALLVLGRAVHAHSYGVPGAIASRVLARTHVPLLVAVPAT
jgi:nucleotide-binding universal stress UspA family protein